MSNEIESERARTPELFVDIVCSNCGKLMAFSNATQVGNLYYCPLCNPYRSYTLDDFARLLKTHFGPERSAR